MIQKFTILSKKFLLILLLINLAYSSVFAQYAGPDQTVCSNSATLQASSSEDGTWSTTGTATILDITSWESGVTNLEEGNNIFTWTVDGTPDDVTITFMLAHAGPDQNVSTTTTQLTGNEPPPGATGQWMRMSGSGEATNPASSTTNVTGLQSGDNVFRWTLTAGCSSSDDITVTATPASAGPDQTNVCNNSTLLDATPVSGGFWTTTSAYATIANATLYNTEVSLDVSMETETEFVWHANGLSDTVLIQNSSIAYVDAGTYDDACSYEQSLAGSTPMGGETGQWTALNTGATFDDPALNATTVRNLAPGENQLEWKISNGVCSDADTAHLFNLKPFVDAGPDGESCDNTYILQGNEPAVGTGTWTLKSGGGFIVNPSFWNSEVNGLGVGTAELYWTIDDSENGCSSMDSVLITNNTVTANAGSDQSVCDSSASITGNTPPSGALGDWLPINTSVYFDDHSSNNTTVRSLDFGINELEWTITNKGCFSSDTISITNNLFLADAGIDAEVCNDSYILQGNEPPSSGKWDLISGGGVIVDQSLYNSEINALGVGEIKLEWSIDNSGCVSRDTVFITNNMVTANAGVDQVVCDSTFGPLTANDPGLQQAYGDWTPVNTSIYFEDHTLYNTKVLSLDIGINQLAWSVFKGSCAASDTVLITYLNDYFADAGPDQAFYSDNYPEIIDTARLNAVMPPEGTAAWSVVQGPAIIDNSIEPKAFVSGLENGENVFRWTIRSGACTAFDDISIVSGYSFMPGDTVTQLNWTDPADWSNGVVPGPNDSVTIVDVEAVIDGDTAYCHAIYISSGSEFNVTGGGALLTDGMNLSKNSNKFGGVEGEAHMIVSGDGALKIGYGSNLKAAGGGNSGGLRIGTGGSVIIEQDAEKATGNGGILSVHGGSIIIEQDAEKADGEGGTMIVRGSVIIEQDAEKSARFKSGSSGNNLVVRRGGSIIIEQDAEKSTAAGGSLRVRGGGSIIIEQDAEKSTYPGGALHLRSGSVIIEQDAEKATFSGNGKLYVKGGSVIIEQDAEKTTYKTELIAPLTEIHGGQIVIGKLSNAKVTGSGFRTGSIIIEQDAEKSTDVDTSLIIKTGGSLLIDASLNNDNPFSLSLGSNTYVTFEEGSTIDLDFAQTGNSKPILIKENASLVDMNESNTLAGQFEHLFVQNTMEQFATPFSSVNSTAFTADANISAWDEVSSAFDVLTTAKDFGYMEGFSITYPAANYLSVTSGTLNSGALSSALNYTEGLNADENGWNLAGNPYPSSIDWELVTANGFATSMYQYDKTSKQYKVYQQGGLSLNGGQQYIMPGQAFFVRAGSATASLGLNNDMRLHYFASAATTTEAPNNYLKLRVEGNGYSDETIVRFTDAATDNYDEVLDAFKLLSPDTEVPQLFTLSGTESLKMTINSLKPGNDNAVTVPLNFRAGVDGTYTLTATDLNFDATIPITLKDLSDNSTHNLVSNPTYSFTYATSDVDARFEIQFGTGITGMDNLNKALNVAIYAFGTDVFIKTFDDKDYRYEIYNMNGKLVKNANLLNKGLNTISMNSLSGIYIVKVISGNKISKKSISIIK